MLSRKFSIVVAAMFTTAALALGLSALGAGQDEHSPLHKLMEKVQANNTVILKGTRSAPNYKKGYDDIVKSADELVKLSKEARKFTEPAKEKKQPQAKWEELMDAFTKEATLFSATVKKKDTQQVAAKDAFKKVTAKCTDCHDVFRPEE